MNQYNLLYNNVPFGGKKQSGIGKSLDCRACGLLLGSIPPPACEHFGATSSAGFSQGIRIRRALTPVLRSGRELGSYALEEYTSVKAVQWNYGEKLDWPL